MTVQTYKHKVGTIEMTQQVMAFDPNLIILAHSPKIICCKKGGDFLKVYCGMHGPSQKHVK